MQLHCNLASETTCALYSTSATATGNTNKHGLQHQLRVEVIVFYGLNCLNRQSSALWKCKKHNDSILENKDLEYFPTTVPQRNQVSIIFGLYCV